MLLSKEVEVEVEVNVELDEEVEVDGLDDSDVAPAGPARSVVSSVAASVPRLNTLVLRSRREGEGRGRCCLWAESDAERIVGGGIDAAAA